MIQKTGQLKAVEHQTFQRLYPGMCAHQIHGPIPLHEQVEVCSEFFRLLRLKSPARRAAPLHDCGGRARLSFNPDRLHWPTRQKFF